MTAVARPAPSAPELERRWASVLEEAGLRPRVLAVADRFPEERSVVLPFHDLEAADAELADLLLLKPEELLEAGRRGLRELLPAAGPGAEGIRLRITGLPVTAHRTVREIRESDLGHFIALDAIVRKATEVRPQIREAVFLCLACKNEVREPQEEWSPIFHEPLECNHCGKTAGRTRFRLLPERSSYLDSQRIEIQENPEKLKGGAHPQGLTALLTEDLTGQVLPGNRVVVNGVLKGLQRVSASRGGAVRSTVFDLLLVGNSIELPRRPYDEIAITEEDEREIRRWAGDPGFLDRIILSLAPSIKGMEEEKEAIALQLFGGVEKRHPDGVRVRGDIHVLLVGDPGTAKSQLLRYISEVAPRGVYTSGKGATAAGLTAAAVKDDFGGGRWVLEAGMLVLSDGGLAAVDELDKMTPEDRSAMHEALEQQTVSIAKAGITATLNARCPVLAAANPKLGRFSSDRPVAEQIDLPPTLLSRFDVIFSIQDKPEATRDRTLANQILLSHQESEARGTAVIDEQRPVRSATAPLSHEFLQKYVAYVRRTVRPVLSDEALRVIEDFYVQVRRQGEEPNSPVPITARQLEALVRLSEASARARQSPVVAVTDARRATRIVESFLKRVATTEGKLDIDNLTTGVTHNMRERAELLMDIMRELMQRNGSFSIEEVRQEAGRRGIPAARADGLFLSYRNQGELIESRPGVWQLVRF